MNSFSDFGDYGEGGGYGGGYDAGGGFAKGGNSSGTPDKKGGKEPSMSTVTPLTARMILDATQNPVDDSLMIGNHQISKVVVCGRVVSVDSRESFIEYRIDDGTGVIAVSKVNDRDQGDDHSDDIPENSYVTVHGGIMNVQGERKVRCHNIRVVQDHNEITHHLLSTVFNHYQNIKGPLNDGSRIQAQQSTSFSGFGASGNFGSNNFNQPVMASGVENMSGGVDRDTRTVHDAIASDMATDTGLSITQVADMLKPRGFNAQKVRNICQILMTEGYIYSTIDDDHFKSTGSLI